MNRDEAKLILQAYRPGDKDAGDPYFAEALALAQKDPELNAWFAEQQAFDARIIGGLHQVRVPSRLKAEILAQNKTERVSVFGWWRELFTRQSPASRTRLYHRFTRSWRELFARQSPASWTVAAVILVVLGLTLFQAKSQSKSSFADYSTQMVNCALSDQPHVDREDNNLTSALASLSSDLTGNNLDLPRRLEGGTGLKCCRALAWHGHKVSMLCFIPQPSGHVDIFVASTEVFSDPPPADQPRFSVNKGTPIAVWSHDGETYLAVSHGNQTSLKNLWLSEKSGGVKLIFLL
jgi:hypothetical protein